MACSKVTILGASGSVGQPLSLLIKRSPIVKQLALYDLKDVNGVTADISHINRLAKVSGYEGVSELKPCLEGSKIVICAAGVARKIGMSRRDLFKLNASTVGNLAFAVGNYCPDALFCILTNPINSVVPVAAEVLKKLGVFDPKKLFGVTNLDIMRAKTFVADAKGLDVYQIHVPVVGGHSASTIVPLISKSVPSISFPPELHNKIVRRIQNAGTEVMTAKEGQGTSSLSVAYATYIFIDAILSVMEGKKGVVQTAYTYSEETECEYFSAPFLLGPEGISRSLGIGTLTSPETKLLGVAIEEVKRSIEVGKAFSKTFTPDPLA